MLKKISLPTFAISICISMLCANAVSAQEQAAGAVQTGASENGMKIAFKQLHGARPQCPLELKETDLTEVEQKQLQKMLGESGIMDVSSFKQVTPMAFGSTLYNLVITKSGESHDATFDDKSASASCMRLVRFVIKHGTKCATAADDQDTTDQGSALDAEKVSSAAKPADAAK